MPDPARCLAWKQRRTHATTWLCWSAGGWAQWRRITLCSVELCGNGTDAPDPEFFSNRRAKRLSSHLFLMSLRVSAGIYPNVSHSTEHVCSTSSDSNDQTGRDEHLNYCGPVSKTASPALGKAAYRKEGSGFLGHRLPQSKRAH